MPKIPSIYMSRGAYKDGIVYNVLPTDGSGDFSFVRGSDATRINKQGVTEVMTNNTPRFDYSEGSCPVLLVEGADGSRNREEFSILGVNSYIDDFEGVLYLEAKAFSNTGSKRYISIFNSSGNSVSFYFDSIDNRVGISNGFVDDFFSVDVLEYNKYALRYNSQSINLFVNGEKTLTSVYSVSYQDFDSIKSFESGAKNFFQGKIKDLRVYKGNMTDQELEELTDDGTIIIPTDFPIFFDSVAVKPTTSAEIVALDSRLVSNGNVFTLDTGTGNSIFCFWLPETVDLVSVVDLDALNAVITNSYESELFTINVVGYDDPIEGKLYTMTQGVPYDNNHRHQITIA